jgi:predicted transcriptional regulator
LLICAAKCRTLLHVKPRSGKPQRISVPVSTAELDILREIANESDRSVSWVAAQAIRFYLDETKKRSASASEQNAGTR